MTSNPRRLDSGLFRESLVVIALTLIGAVIRLWSLGHVGLIHFDEGIYAIAGLWVFSPRGLLGFDPNLVAYAPPGFPFLVGLSYLFFGVADVAAVLVSIVAGTLTIPAVGWVARRTFGCGAGASAAALTALSGAHIAFSRMALVDASSLLFWVLAIGQGQRFLERPKPMRAVWLGLAVGIAQLFKYNGWVSGVIVALSAGLWLLIHPVERNSRRTIATWGWGFVAALVAAMVYWPWFQFVESHGGYPALLAHQRSYLGGLSSWPGHWLIQLDHAAALSGGPVWLGCGGTAASVAMLLSVGDFRTRGRFLFRILVEAMSLSALCMLPKFPWWVCLFWISIAQIQRKGIATLPTYLLVTGWVTLSVLTPFYHPYARLWLPVQAFGWIIVGSVFVSVGTSIEIAGRGSRWTWNLASDPLPWFALVCILSGVSDAISSDLRRKPLPIRHLEPSDSVRMACRAVQQELPKDVKSLRVFARRPIIFYLALDGGVTVFTQPDLDHLLEQGGDRTSWALLDMAMVRQDNISEEDLSRSLGQWVVVRDIPTTLNMATLLDIEPAAARSGPLNVLASLRLLRPKRAGGGALMNPEPPVSLWPDPQALGPITDLYELTMMAGYYASGMANRQATFELFVRKMPANRAYLIFAGLEQVIGDLLRLAFAPEQIEAIHSWPAFREVDPSIMDWLGSQRFEGDVWSVPEGTVVFPGETLLRVTAPLPQAQWVETLLVASMAYPTLVASKAARVVTAAGGRLLFEFGARRGHGPQAGMLAARAAYLAGFSGTSHVEAGRRLGIPVTGTMAHSWVQSFGSESESFEAFARVFPHTASLLVDTYDTLDGVRLAAAIEPPVQAIRIDSGDVGALARQARAILDEQDRPMVKIMASGDLDERRIAQLVASGAPLDGFGVGTELITSRDAPALPMVYKLVELEGEGKFKLSPGKKTYPMAKQVFRKRDRSGRFLGDHVTRADETADGEPLLVPILRSGRFVNALPSLESIRGRCREQLAALPERLLGLDAQPDYPITYSDILEADAKRLMSR